jgi:hypothetical protein
MGVRKFLLEMAVHEESATIALYKPHTLLARWTTTT